MQAFKPDYRIALLSVLGILGFITGCIFIFYSDLYSFRKVDSVFHEITYIPKNIVGKPIVNAIDSLQKINIERQTQKIINENSKPVESIEQNVLTKENLILEEKVNIDKENIKQFKVYYNSLEFTSIRDTSSFKRLNSALHFMVDPKLLKEWNRSFYKEDKTSFKTKYAFKDPKITYSLVGTGILQIIPATSDIEFITKYPSAGVWVLLILIFCSFSFIAISTSIYLNKQIVKLFAGYNITGLTGISYFYVVITIFLILLLLVFIWNKTFYDVEVVENFFFMKSLPITLSLVQILGYIAGSFCLAGFIHTAAMLGYFAKDISVRKKKIETQNKLDISEVIKNCETNSESNQDELTLLRNIQLENKKIYISLYDFFNTYFVLSAIILSLMVLCTGALFSTVNSLDFVKLITDDWGYSPARTDFIYLYGGLHTVVLLLVYIPAKMRFGEIDIVGEDVKPQQANSKWFDFLKSPFSQLKNVLIVTSPFLASLIQSLFDLVFK